MIKTKSILEKPSSEDGTRICVMRYVKPFYKYDEWLVDLAPSKLLLNSYRNSSIGWKEYESRYTNETDRPPKVKLIKSLIKRSNDGEIITLLCWEKDDSKCHRRLLKEVIDGTNVGI